MYFSGFNQRNQQGFNPLEELFHQILQQQQLGNFGGLDDDEEVYDIPNGRTMDDILNESFQMAQNATKGPPPAKKEFVNRLPVYKYTEERKEQMQKCTENLSCAVCQTDFEMGDDMLQLPCYHSFHKDCIKPWITEHNTCPVCRYELPVDDFKEEQQRQQRMIERFTKNGLKLMEIGSEIETAFMSVTEISQQFQESQKQGAVSEETRKQLLSKLNQADSVLMNKMIELDSMENLENSQVKDQRKQLLLKIQTIQSIIDKCKNMVRSSS